MDGNQAILDTLSAISMALIFLLILVNVSQVRFAKIQSIGVVAIFAITIRGMDFVPVDMGVASVLTQGIMILIATFMVNRKLLIITLSMFYAILMSVISLLAGQIASSIMFFSLPRLSNLRNIPEDIASSAWVLTLLYVTISLIFSFFASNLCGRFLHRRLGNFGPLLRSRFIAYLLVGATLTLVLFLITVLLHDMLESLALLELAYGLSLGLYFACFVFSLFAFSNSMQILVESRHLQAYIESIEVVNKDLRVFRHDHFNLLLGFSEYIKSGDLAGMEDYYNSYLKTMHSNADIAAFNLNLDLLNIKIPSIKAILSYKLQYAHFCGIDVKVKTIGEVSSIRRDIGMIDLCRIIGILLDNAIEACTEQIRNDGKAVFEFATINNDKSITLQFANTFHILPSLLKMFEEGFTTKPDGRGLGLYIASKIVEEYDGLTLESYIDDYGMEKYLIHELIVEKGK